MTRNTIAHWVKFMLDRSGVDIVKFKAGSVQPAVASQAMTMSVPITCIMAKAGWSRESTFAKFYDKHVITTGDPFKKAVLA